MVDTMATTEATGLRARRKAETRTRILDAAARVYTSSSPAATPLELVAAEARVSKATLFFHFGTRTELFAQLGHHLYMHEWNRLSAQHPAGPVAFARVYLDGQTRPLTRLIWQLGDLLAADRPDALDAAYWHLVDEFHRRLVAVGIADPRARSVARVLAPATMLVARRAAQDLATAAEIDAYLASVEQLTA